MSEDTRNQEMQEEETLNQQQEEGENQEDTQDEEPQAPKTYSEEEVEAIKKELQSNSEKGVQKVISEKKLFERAYKELPKIANDDSYLVELYEDSPELAKRILEDHFDGQSIEDYKESIWYKEDLSDPKQYEAKLKREVAKATREKEIESSKTAFIEKLWMSDEEKAKFEEELSEIIELPKYKTQSITKVMERAYKLAFDWEDIKKMQNAAAIANATAGKKWGSRSKPADWKTETQKQIDAWKKKMNIS